jgi:hypothetical protein
MTTKKHYVTFYSPGSFCDEMREVEIHGWSPPLAVELSRKVVERYGSRPYGFSFCTKIVSDKIPDGFGGELSVEPKTVEKSGMYYVNGKMKTIEDVKAENDPGNRILIANMESNGWSCVVETNNGFKHTSVFNNGDQIVYD